MTFHGLGLWGRFRSGGGDPLEQPQGQAQVAFGPGPQGHRATGIVEGLAPIPEKGITVALAAVAAQAGRYAVLGHAQPAAAEGMDVIDRFGGLTAVKAPPIGHPVQGLSPSSRSQFWAEVFEKDSIPGLHQRAPVGRSLASASGVAMCS